MKKWPQNIRDYYWLHDVLQIYVDMGVWVIQWDGKDGLDWMELTPQSGTKLRPSHFEIIHHKQADRDQYYRASFRRLAREQKPLVSQHRGIYDLFIPLGPSEQGFTALYGGFFLRKPAEWDQLADQWRKLTGRNPVSSDPELMAYVRMCLKLPVFDGPLLKGVLEFFEGSYAKLIMGSVPPEGLSAGLDRLRREVFAPRLPNTAWVNEALGFEKLAPPPWRWYPDQGLAPWMKEELGIDQVPTTVFTVMPLPGTEGEAATPKNLVLNNLIQRECFAFSKTLPQTVAGSLQDYGVVFLTSPDPSKSEVQGRLQIREKAEAVQAFVKKRFGLRSVAGIGRPVPKGNPLYRSYQEAVLALHFCVQSEKPLLFYDENPRSDAGPAYARLDRAASGLLTAIHQASPDGTQVASDPYVREVLEFAAGSVEVVRGQFLALLFRVLEDIRQRIALNPEDERSYIEDFCRRLTEADSAYRLIDLFKETLRTLSALSSDPVRGSQEVRLRTTLRYIEEHFNRPLRLPQVAKRSGFSVPVFCRVFKRATGMSFAAYLNKVRVERSKPLLKNGRLNLLQVGQACGFQTAHQFIRNFKRWTGRTPGHFRQEASQASR